MEWKPTHLTYRQTGYFSRLITDYLDQAENLSPFYSYPADAEGLRSALAARKAGKPVDRATLVSQLEEQYAGVLPGEFKNASRVRENIARLGEPNTFTLCTAHQPAIFTGHLYFIYKILHTIRLAEWMAEQHPGDHFVPVFFMGSEDADLEELGHISLGGETLVWETKQTGAVGRMSTKGLDKLFYRIEGELSVQPYGQQLMAILREAYLESPDIQTATFKMIHRLFAEWGLIVLIADRAAFKKQMIPVFEDDLFRQQPSGIVGESIDLLGQNYDIQANPRDINLFYLNNDLRGRIERTGEGYKVHGSALVFTEAGLREELQRNPERFSPNVILRGLFQETILPNLAFIGGGGETAYWLELKGLFDHYRTPFPVLVLRSSFQLVERQWMEKMERAGFGVDDLFRDEQDLMTELVRRDSTQTLSLEEEIATANQYYEGLKALARPVDPTLEEHVAALQVKAIEPIRLLEKKLLKAEKRKFGEQQRQIHQAKEALFPGGHLQERVENILPWYALYGPGIIRSLYATTPVWGSFIVLVEP
jgi:bacillithiol biosynthesis cysteine-adding enzyme BshC